MTILFNTDRTIKGSQAHNDHYIGLIKDELAVYSEHITRVDVHVSDENGRKEGLNDIRCMIEAHASGRPPVVVTDQADTESLAVAGAIEKMKHALQHSIDRHKDHHAEKPLGKSI